MKIKVLLLVIFSFYFLEIKAQEPTTKKWKSEIGAAAGFTTGYGLSYRGYYNKLGVQFTFFPYKSSTYTNFSTGLSFLFKLRQKEKTNFYLYQGNHFFYTEDTYASKFPQGNPGGNSPIINKFWNNGIGVGLEIIALKNIGINIMGGVAGYDYFEIITLTGEMGVFYKF